MGKGTEKEQPGRWEKNQEDGVSRYSGNQPSVKELVS